jgi:phospholipid-binding lipoprotein MlaA
VLDASNLLEEAALDRYEFIRDGFLQRRQSQVYGRRRPQGQAQANPQARRRAGRRRSIKAAYPDDPGPAGATPASACPAPKAVAPADAKPAA